MRRDGYDGWKHPRTRLLDSADTGFSDWCLRTAGDMDFYRICDAEVPGDPVSVVPDLLGCHGDGTYDLFLAGDKETAESGWAFSAGMNIQDGCNTIINLSGFEKEHKQDDIKKVFDNPLGVKKKHLTPRGLSCMITQVMRNGKNC